MTYCLHRVPQGSAFGPAIHIYQGKFPIKLTWLEIVVHDGWYILIWDYSELSMTYCLHRVPQGSAFGPAIHIYQGKFPIKLTWLEIVVHDGWYILIWDYSELSMTYCLHRVPQGSAFGPAIHIYQGKFPIIPRSRRLCL